MRCTLTVITLCMATLAAHAADWPQWLGPTRDGVSTEKVAPWEKSPKIAWRAKVGEGHSSPVVAGGKVFLHFRREKDGMQKTFEEVAAAYDAKNGDVLWERACGDTSKMRQHLRQRAPRDALRGRRSPLHSWRHGPPDLLRG